MSPMTKSCPGCNGFTPPLTLFKFGLLLMSPRRSINSSVITTNQHFPDDLSHTWRSCPTSIVSILNYAFTIYKFFHLRNVKIESSPASAVAFFFAFRAATSWMVWFYCIRMLCSTRCGALSHACKMGCIHCSLQCFIGIGESTLGINVRNVSWISRMH